MEKLSEGERLSGLLLVLGLLYVGWQIDYAVGLNERMAQEGYEAYQIPGHTEVFWRMKSINVFIQHEDKKDNKILKEF